MISNLTNLEDDLKAIDDGIEVNPIQYLRTDFFVIGRLAELGVLKVRRDREGEVHFMKADMDDLLARVKARSARLTTERALPTKGV
jgi:hypothetical protein